MGLHPRTTRGPGATGNVTTVAVRLPTVTITGDHVRLEPLSHEHASGLVAAAAVDRSSYGFTWVPDGVEATEAYITTLHQQHERGEVLPFAQRRVDTGEVVGCTRFMELRWWSGRDAPDEVEIGGTWLAADAQRTAVNTEAKFLLFRHAFDQYGAWRVALCTDARNERSRVAIERLGARFEGILRNHRRRADVTEPAPRDSALYAVTRDDWPDVRSGLERQLGR